MKEFLYEHLDVVLYGVALISVLAIFFSGTKDERGNAGIFKNMADTVSDITASEDYSTCEDYEKLEAIAALPGPAISCNNKQRFYSGTNYKASDFISAYKTDDNSVLPFTIAAIKNVFDNSDCLDTVYNSSSGMICFPNDGVYAISVSATYNYHVVTYSYQFAVNGG